MNQIELTHGVLHLIPLQMPDEMPFDLALQSLRLIQCLLHAVLSNVHNTGVNGLPHRLHGVILRHGDQLHGSFLRHMCAACTRRRNRTPHLLNPPLDHRTLTHLSSITAASRPVLPPAAR